MGNMVSLKLSVFDRISLEKFLPASTSLAACSASFCALGFRRLFAGDGGGCRSFSIGECSAVGTSKVV